MVQSKQTDMKTEKQYAFPFSVLCTDDRERAECIKILEELGYFRYMIGSDSLIVSNQANRNGIYTDLRISGNRKYDHNRHHIPHFDAALVRDIAAACTNDTWQKGEPRLSQNNVDYGYITSDSIFGIHPNGYKRPTLAEICAHHGYIVDGKDIVKQQKQTTVKEKKYRAYTKVPIEILGKGIRCVKTPFTSVIGVGGAAIITAITPSYSSVAAFGALITSDELSRYFVFIDTGLPVGEEYEEECKPFEFVHDTAYCVREGIRCVWGVRYFKEYFKNMPVFYNDGLTSLSSHTNLSTNWSQVAPYDKCLVGKCQEPDVYLFKKD